MNRTNPADGEKKRSAAPSASRSKPKTWNWRICLLMLSVALANLPFWLLSQEYAIERAQVSVDVLVALAVMAWRPGLGVVCLILAWTADGLVSQSMTFYFNTSVAFLDSARFAHDLKLSRFLTTPVLVSIFLFGTTAWVLTRLSRLRRPEVLLSVAAFILLVTLDVLNGSSRYAFGDRRLLPMNIAGSPAVTMMRQYAEVQRHDPPESLAAGQSVMQTAEILDWAKSHPDRSVWLVLVESMGWPLSESLRAWVQEPLEQLKGRYTVDLQRLPFKGATTSGELRALCALKGRYADLQASQGAQCLPSQLERLGWRTIGLHGFTGQMFDRRSWWPAIGIGKSLFKEDLMASRPLCGGAFTGICDAGLLQASGHELMTPRTFVYSLTLNTHLPLDHVDVPADLRKICTADGVSEAACELSAAHQRVLSRLAAQAVDVSGGHPLIVVLGDHAPPFVDKESRAAFDPTTVPAFVLRPR